MEIDSMPVELDEIERKLRQLEIEKQAVMRDGGRVKGRLGKDLKEMSVLQEKRDELRAQWLREKEIICTMRGMKEQIEKTKMESERAEREGDLAKAAELRYGKLLELQTVPRRGKYRGCSRPRREEKC